MKDECTKTGWCKALYAVFTEANRKGVNVVRVEAGGRCYTAGVAFKKTQRDRGVMFNFCPFCGQRIEGDDPADAPQEEAP